MSRRHGARTMALVLVLAAVSIGSLIGMLLADGIWDTVFLLLAALPLLAGALSRGYRRRGQATGSGSG